MKRILALLLAITLVFALSACGKSETASNTETNPTDKKDNAVNQVVQEVMNEINLQKEFVIGEELKNLNSEQLSLPINENEKANIQEISITKSKILDINKTEDFNYYSGEYVFYKYQYTIKISGNINSKYAQKYIRTNFYFPDGTMKIQTFFKGRLSISEIGSHGYSGKTDLTDVSGCVCKIENDGSFKGEITVFSNDNINEYMITGVGFTTY